MTCDTFRLTLQPGDYTGKAIAIRISWGTASNNYDLYLHRAPSPASTNAQANATTPIAQSRTSGSGTREAVLIDPGVSGGGDYTVHVVYVAGSTADQYQGSATVVAKTPDMAAAMTDSFPSHGDGKAHEGDTIDYSVTITNNGGATANGTKLNDPAPANTTDVAGSLRMSAVAIDDNYSVNFNTGLSVPAPGVLGNDKGIPSPSAVPIASGTTAAGGTVTLNADGSFSYTPQNNFGGTDSFSYTATNVQPPNDSATVTIKVHQVPTDIALSNSTVDENHPAGTDVGTLSTTDPDSGDTHTYSLVTGTGDTDNASFQINGATLKTGASFDFETKSSYSVRIQTDDGHGGTLAKQFAITVNNVNEPPTATDQSLSTNEDTPLAITLTGTDPENDTLGFSHDAVSAHSGTISGAGANVTYTPPANYSGTDTFNFSVDDSHGHSDSGTITITVNGVNDAPVATADSFTTDEDTPLSVAAPGVLSNDSDIDSSPITAVLVSGPTHAGSFTLNTDGSFSYTPAANYNGSDSFFYKANDGNLDSNTVKVSLTINAVNDAPTATDQTLSTNEDTPVPITLAGTDPDGDSLTFTYAQPSHGTVDGTAPNVTYHPTTDYSGPDSFTFTADDGHGGADQGNIDITVNTVNDAPVVDLDNTQPGTSSTVSFLEIVTHNNSVELAPKAEVSDVDDPKLESGKIVLTNRPDGNAESIAVDTSSAPAITAAPYDGATGTITLTGNGTLDDYQKVFRSATYQNSAAPPNPADRIIEFTVNDGDVDSAVATATVKVLPINAPPIVDLNGTATPGLDTSASFTEDSPAVAVAPNADVTDADNANLDKITVTVTNHPDGAAELLTADVSLTPSIAVVAYDPATGVLLLKGVDTVAHFQQALRTVKYSNSSNNPTTTTRNITVVANDGQDNSLPATSAVSITPHNDAPTATDQSVSTDEDTDKAITLSGTDPENDSLTFTYNQPAHGTVDGTAPNVTYHPAANYNGSDSFTFTADDGNGGTDQGTVSITVNATNDPPTNIALSNSSVAENLPTGANVGDFSTTDPDGDTTFTYTLVAGTGDDDNPSFQIAGSTLQTNATFDFETKSSYSIRVKTDDGHGGTFEKVFTITITDANDAPVANNDTGTTNEDTVLNVAAAGVLTNDTDPDAGDTKTVTKLNGSTTLTGTASDGGAVTINANGSYSYNPGSLHQNLNTGGTATATFTYTMRDTAGLESTATVTITITGVNDNPVALAKTFNGANGAIGNTALVVNDPADAAVNPSYPHKSISGSLLTGATDVDNGTLTVVPGSFGTNDGGTVTIEADGDFIFFPAASTSCTDTSDFFTYTISDGQGGTGSAQVTIAISGCVWYVDNNNASGNSGTADKPFDTLAQAQTASGTGHTIFIFKGDGTSTGYNTGITLKTNQRLIGEEAGLAVGTDTLQGAVANAYPILSNNNADVVTLATGAVVQGVRIDPQNTGGGIFGGSTVTGATIDDVRIIDTGTGGTQACLELNGGATGRTAGAATFNISNLVIDNSAASGTTSGSVGVLLTNVGTVNFLSSGTITIKVNGAKGLDASNGAGVTSFGAGSVFDDITVTNSGSGGVSLSGTTGTVALGDGSGPDLTLTTVSGAAAALSINNSTNVSIPSNGTANITATGGPAVDIVSSALSLNLGTVSSTNSASNGINLNGLGTGTFSCNNSSSISSATGADFSISGGSGNVTYPGTINDDVGQLVRIVGATGGTKSFTGAITDNDDGDGGIATEGSIYINGNSATTVTFSGGLVVSTSAGFPAFTATSNTTGAVNVCAFNPCGGASTVVNKLTTTTGTALTITNTTIGDGDLTFRSISSNGAANGIVVNGSTNANGALVVTGNSSGVCGGSVNTATTPATVTSPDTSDCTGGTIQNSSGAGVSLTSLAGGASFTRLRVTTSGSDGVSATSVSGGVSLLHCLVSNNGNGADENGVEYQDVNGTSTFDGTTVTASAFHNARIATTVGTHNLTVTNCVFSLTTAANGQTGLQISSGGTATVNANVIGNLSTGNKDTPLSVVSSAGSPTVNVNVLNNDLIGATPPNQVPAAQGLSIVSGDGTKLKAKVENNDIIGADGKALLLFAPPNSTTSATFDVIVNNNRIGNGNPDSGSIGSNALAIDADGGATTKIAVTNNTIQHWQVNAVRIVSGEKDVTNPSLNQPGSAAITITGNTISNRDGTGDTINVDVGVQSAAAAQNVCMDIGGAGALSNAFGGTHGPNAGDFDLQISENFQGNLTLAGFSGDGSDQNAIQTFIRSRNSGNPTFALVDNPLSGGVSSCAQPTAPPAPTP